MAHFYGVGQSSNARVSKGGVWGCREVLFNCIFGFFVRLWIMGFMKCKFNYKLLFDGLNEFIRCFFWRYPILYELSTQIYIIFSS